MVLTSLIDASILSQPLNRSTVTIIGPTSQFQEDLSTHLSDLPNVQIWPFSKAIHAYFAQATGLW